MIQADLFTLLSATIGSDVSTRIYPGIAPMTFTAPLAVYNCVSRKLEQTMSDGVSDYMHTGVQVDIYAATYGSAHVIAKKVRDAIKTWTVPITVSVMDAGTDMVEDSVQPNLYRVSMQFILDHLDS